MKKCSFCAEEIQDEAILCHYCGRKQKIPGTATQGKNIFPFLVAFLALMIVTLFITAFLLLKDRDTRLKNLSQVEAELRNTQANLQEQLDQVAAELALNKTNLEKEKSNSSLMLNELNSSTATVSALQASYAEMAIENEEARNSLIMKQLAIDAMESKIACNVKSDLSELEGAFTSNPVMSSSLRRFVEETRGDVIETKWDVVWNHSKAALHKFTSVKEKSEKTLDVFIVFFTEDWGSTQGIFWMNNQCWLIK